MPGAIPESPEPQYDLLFYPEPVSFEPLLTVPTEEAKEAAETRLRRAQAKVLFREAEKCRQSGNRDRAGYLYKQVTHLSPDASLIAKRKTYIRR